MDAHRILGVAPGADLEQLRRARRAALFSCHPDRNPGDPGAAGRFREVEAAYRELAARLEQDPDGFRPLGAPAVTDVRVPLAHAIAGARLRLSSTAGPLEVEVPPGCGAGVVLSAADGRPVRVAHLIPPQFTAKGDDLLLDVDVVQGRLGFRNADGHPVAMNLGPTPPLALTLTGWGAPRAGRVGDRGDLVLRIRTRHPVGASGAREEPRPGRIVDARA